MAARRDASGRADKPWLQSEAEYYVGGGFASFPEAVAYLFEPAMSAGIVQLGTWRASSPDRAYDLGAMLFFTDRRPTSLWTQVFDCSPRTRLGQWDGASDGGVDRSTNKGGIPLG